jgi:hypothetical protein
MNCNSKTTDKICSSTFPPQNNKKLSISRFVYIYKHNFKDVLNLLRDFNTCSKIVSNSSTLKNIISEYTLIKGNQNWEEGSEFNYVYRGLIRAYKRVICYEQKENFAKIKYLIYKTEPATFNFYVTVHFYKSFNDEYTTFVKQWEHYLNVNESQAAQGSLNEERYQIFSILDKHLENTKLAGNVNLELTYIESNFDKVWRVINNLKVLQSMVPSICDEVICEKELIEKNSELKLIWKLPQSEENYVKLKVVKIINYSSFCEIEYESSDGQPQVPKQNIIWRVEKTNENFCLIKFSHFYNEKVSKTCLKMISKLKKTILKELRVKLEGV